MEKERKGKENRQKMAAAKIGSPRCTVTCTETQLSSPCKALLVEQAAEEERRKEKKKERKEKKKEEITKSS